MSPKTLFPVAAFCFCAFAAGVAVARQDDEPRKKLYEMDMNEQMELQMQIMQLMQPGPEHERLTTQVGSFVDETKVWMRPDADPITIEGTSESELILGGRFLMSRAEFSFPMLGDMEGLRMMGFDRRHGEYTIVGFDTMGTYYITAAGKWDEERQAIVLHGTDEDPFIGEQVYDFVMEFPDEDTVKTSLIFYDMYQEGPFKLMEITSRREQ